MSTHSSLTDPELHEPKGASTATAGQVYIANGSGSGSWSNMQHGATSVAFTSSDVTLTASQYTKSYIVATGTLSANVNMILPTSTDPIVVYNNTTGAYTFTVKTAAGTGIVIASTKKAMVLADGTNIIRVTADI